MARRSTGFRPARAAKAGSGGPGDADRNPAGAEDPERPLEVLAADAVEHQVVSAEHPLEVLGAVVDHRLGPELAHEVGVRRADRGGDARSEVPGELDRDRSDAAGARVDQNPLPRLHVADLDEGLPRGERDERQRAGLGHADRHGLRRQVGLGDGDALGERAGARGARVDLVADRERPHRGTDADHRSRHVAAEGLRQPVRQDLLELPRPDLLVEHVAGGCGAGG